MLFAAPRRPASEVSWPPPAPPSYMPPRELPEGLRRPLTPSTDQSLAESSGQHGSGQGGPGQGGPGPAGVGQAGVNQGGPSRVSGDSALPGGHPTAYGSREPSEAGSDVARLPHSGPPGSHHSNGPYTGPHRSGDAPPAGQEHMPQVSADVEIVEAETAELSVNEPTQPRPECADETMGPPGHPAPRGKGSHKRPRVESGGSMSGEGQQNFFMQFGKLIFILQY